MLLTTAIGNDPSTSIAMRVVAVDVPASFLDAYPGPRFGVDGWRRVTGVKDRPLLLNMIKPCTGFPPHVGAAFAAESARGGVDLIKDDELLADPSFSPVADRTRAYVAAIEAASSATGRATRYVAHVTTRPGRLAATARAAVEAGAGAVMITPLTLGLDALAELAEVAAVPILAHVAAIETWTGAAEGGVGHGALARLLRLAGADAVLTSTPHAPRPLPAGAYAAVARGLRDEVAGGRLRAALPMPGGGITADHVAPIIETLGLDAIIAVGGAIQGHPDGAAAGGRVIQSAIADASARYLAGRPRARERIVTRPLIGTSWKMNLTPSEAVRWFETARPLLEPLTAARDLFVLPPFPAIFVARDALAGTAIGWGGQDLHPDDDGAHTGDVSGAMLADLGARYAEMGHSERRRDHAETDDVDRRQGSRGAAVAADPDPLRRRADPGPGRAGTPERRAAAAGLACEPRAAPTWIASSSRTSRSGRSEKARSPPIPSMSRRSTPRSTAGSPSEGRRSVGSCTAAASTRRSAPRCSPCRRSPGCSSVGPPSIPGGSPRLRRRPARAARHDPIATREERLR